MYNTIPHTTGGARMILFLFFCPQPSQKDTFFELSRTLQVFEFPPPTLFCVSLQEMPWEKEKKTILLDDGEVSSCITALPE